MLKRDVVERIKKSLSKITDKNWLMINVIVEINSDNSIKYNKYEYIDNLGETKDLYIALNKELIYDEFMDLYNSKEEDDNWNSIALEFFKEDSELNIDFSLSEISESDYISLEIDKEYLYLADENKLVFEDEREVYDYFLESLSDMISYLENWEREDWDPFYNWLEIKINVIKNLENIEIVGTYTNLEDEIIDITFSNYNYNFIEVFNACYEFLENDNLDWISIDLKLKNKILREREEVFVNIDTFNICYNKSKKESPKIDVKCIYDSKKHFLHSPIDFNIVKTTAME